MPCAAANRVRILETESTWSHRYADPCLADSDALDQIQRVGLFCIPLFIARIIAKRLHLLIGAVEVAAIG
mgnify:CR=1 FL=1